MTDYDQTGAYDPPLEGDAQKPQEGQTAPTAPQTPSGEPGRPEGAETGPQTDPPGSGPAEVTVNVGDVGNQGDRVEGDAPQPATPTGDEDLGPDGQPLDAEGPEPDTEP